MTLHRRPAALPAALAETARVFPLCVLMFLVFTAINLREIGGILPSLPFDRYLLTAALAIWPATFGALAGALLYLGGPPRKRLIAHAMGFVVGLAGGSWAVGSWTEIPSDVPTILSIALLAYLAAALAAGQAAGGGPGGFWRANILGLTGIAIGLAVVYAGLAGFGLVAYALKALLDVEAWRAMHPLLTIGTVFVLPVIALAALRPSALADAARPGAGFMAVLAMIADGLLISMMIALSLVIHVYAAMIVVDGSLPRGAIGWIATTYLAAGYGLYLLVDGLPVGFRFLRRAFRLAWVPSTAVPLLLLGLATHARIEQYGVTEERYGLVLVVVAGTILFAAALLRRPFDIRIVPATVAILAGIAAGPFGATATMVRSQVARAQVLLAAVPPEYWAEKGLLALARDQEETLVAVMRALDRRGRLAALTDTPSWPAALPKTRRELPDRIPYYR